MLNELKRGLRSKITALLWRTQCEQISAITTGTPVEIGCLMNSQSSDQKMSYSMSELPQKD